MQPPATWRVTNVVAPVTRYLFITGGFVRLSKQAVGQRCHRKSKRPQRRECISQETSTGRSFEVERLLVNRQPRF